MAEESKLPEQWQELPQVQNLVQQAVGEVKRSLTTVNKERDVLKKELQELKKELEQLRADATDKAGSTKNAPDTAGSQDQQERKRLEALAKQQQERIKALETELKAKDRRLAEAILERGIRDAVAKVGEVHKDAWPDVVARGKRTFSLDEQGQPVARDLAGNVIYDDDGLKPMSFETWARKLLADAPHLFKATGSKGSGATGGAGQDEKNGPVTLSKEQARNPLTYRRAKEKAAKLGTELVIQ